MTDGSVRWPPLSYSRWSDAVLTLQLWMQIVGKIRLAATPWLNHSWQVPFYVTTCGLGTSPIPAGDEILEFEFDFVRHRLVARISSGQERDLTLEPRSVADFFAEISPSPDRFRGRNCAHRPPLRNSRAIPFSTDLVHSAYDPQAAHAFWRTLVSADRVLKLFRTGYVGKASPVHFFWGSFDLAVTRFSGRRAPLHPGGVAGLSDRVVREAYSHEVSSAGFWPGGAAYPHPIFYSYAYPEPAGFRQTRLAPPARYEPALGEFVLPYAALHDADDPDGMLLEFLSRNLRRRRKLRRLGPRCARVPARGSGDAASDRVDFVSAAGVGTASPSQSADSGIGINSFPRMCIPTAFRTARRRNARCSDSPRSGTLPAKRQSFSDSFSLTAISIAICSLRFSLIHMILLNASEDYSECNYQDVESDLQFYSRPSWPAGLSLRQK